MNREIAWDYLSDLEKAQLMWMRPDLRPPETDKEDEEDEQAYPKEGRNA